MKNLSKAKYEALKREKDEVSEKYKHIASEIVRGMTNGKLTKEQQDRLLYVSEIVIKNNLGFYEKYKGIY